MIFKNPRDLKDTKGFEICLDKDMSISLICSRISRKTLIVAHDCRLQTHLPHTQAHQLQSQMVMRTGPMSNDVFQCNCTNLTCPDSLRVHLHNNTHKPAMRPSGAGTLPHRESHRATPPIRVRSPRRPSIWRAQLGMFLEKIKTREHHDRTGPPPTQLRQDTMMIVFSPHALQHTPLAEASRPTESTKSVPARAWCRRTTMKPTVLGVCHE